MGDAFNISNAGGIEVLTGAGLSDPGATPGDVLTIQDDGSVAAEAGGGGGGYTYTGDGSPVGVVDAAEIGNTYLDSTNGASYFATTADADGWVLVAGLGASTDTGVVSGEGEALLQDGTGAFYGAGAGEAGNLIAQPGASGKVHTLRDGNANSAIVITNDGADTQLGFFGADPVVQPTLTSLSTAAEIVAALQALGLAG